MTAIIPVESIINKIVFLRGEKVSLDQNLAGLQGVETKQLKRAVRRNIKRSPKEFMFQLMKKEFENLRSHFGTSSWDGTHYYMPLAFTEQGVAMFTPLNAQLV